MDIPSSIRITKRIKYEVVYQDEIKEDPECLGYSDPVTRLIHLKKDQTKQEEIETFFHELTHAICKEYSININHKEIYKIEKAIYKFLTLNKFI